MEEGNELSLVYYCVDRLMIRSIKHKGCSLQVVFSSGANFVRSNNNNNNLDLHYSRASLVEVDQSHAARGSNSADPRLQQL